MLNIYLILLPYPLNKTSFNILILYALKNF